MSTYDISSKTNLSRIVINNKQVKLKDQKFTLGNPQIQHFKRVYHKYYNFSKESNMFVFKGDTVLDFNNEKKFSCILDKRADYLSNVFLTLELPKIAIDDEYNIRYIQNLGLGIIKNIDLKMNGDVISSLDGKKIYIVNKLLENECDVSFVNKDTTIRENDMKYKHTTTNTSRLYKKPINTNIEKIKIPIPFGFFKHNSINIPIFLFNKNNIEIELTLRPLKEIYTVQTFDKDYWYYAKDELHYQSTDNPSTSALLRTKALTNTDFTDTSATTTESTLTYGEQTKPVALGSMEANYPYYLKRYESRTCSVPNESNSSEDIRTYLYNKMLYNRSSMDYNIRCYLDTEQIYISKELKIKMLTIPLHSIVFKQCQEDTIYTHKEYSEQEKLKIYFANPVEQLLLAVNRSDNHLRNEWINFSNYEDSTLTEEKVTMFQDNLWHSSSSGSDVQANVSVTGGTHNNFTITVDKFQDFLFTYGPYGEAYHGSAGTTNWPNKVPPQYEPYTIEDIDTFRSIWKYRSASDIPVITSSNFQNTWKETPVNNMDIVYYNEIREENKHASYFNKVQPYIYGNNILDPGLFLYSYSLEVNKMQPHGSYLFDSNSMFFINISLNKAQTFNSISNYFTITPYATCLNMLQIKNNSYELLFNSH